LYSFEFLLYLIDDTILLDRCRKGSFEIWCYSLHSLLTNACIYTTIQKFGFSKKNTFERNEYFYWHWSNGCNE